MEKIIELYISNIVEARLASTTRKIKFNVSHSIENGVEKEIKNYHLLFNYFIF